MTEFHNNPPLSKLTSGQSLKLSLQIQMAMQKKLHADALNQIAKSLQQSTASDMQNKSILTSNLKPPQNELINPATNQTVLNLSNQATKNEVNINAQNIVTQLKGEGARDLPPYAGISNISFQSWLSEQNNKGFANLSSKENLLVALLNELSGFQRKNGKKLEQSARRNNGLQLLTYIFSNGDPLGTEETEIISNILSFKKLGLLKKEKEKEKLEPPPTSEVDQTSLPEDKKIKYLSQLLALPEQFPEGLRLFARSKNYIDPMLVSSFLSQKFKSIQKRYLGNDSDINKIISTFVPLTNHSQFSQIIPLVLLYYPLPVPFVNPFFNFKVEWKKKKKTYDKEKKTVATCEVYYYSKKRGGFLIKFELVETNQGDALNFDIQTQEENLYIVEKIELAISEALFLLAIPPSLFELNILFENEISHNSKHGDEISIISSGPLRLELLLSVYASLIVLNALS